MPSDQPSADYLQNRTNALIKLPPGRLDYESWREAKRMLYNWSKQSKPSLHAATKAEQLLERLVKEAQVNERIQLTATIYNQCMSAFAKSGAAVRAHAILERMQSRYKENPTVAPEPDTISYNTLLHAWAMSEDDCATEKAEELIHLMEERHRTNPNGPVNPTTWSYNLVILAYANRVGEYGSAKAAEDWLLRLSELNIADGPRPDTFSFNLVLKAWANSQDEKGPDRALEILRLFIKLSNEGHDVHPDASSFTTVINSYAKRGNVMKAQEVLYLTREADLPERTDITPCFNAVIDSWAKSGAEDAGHMAETVLTNAMSYSEIDGHVVVAPNVITYTACLDAHIKTNHPHALESAEDFLWRMIDSFRSGEWKVGPTTRTFACIIDAWAKSDRENRTEKAESWLRVMEDLAKREGFKCLPNAQVFNTCIDAWLDSNAPDASARASRILRWMEQSYEEGNKHARPNGSSHRTMVQHLVSSDQKNDALEALVLVKKMEQQARQGNAAASPDTGTCNKVIYRLTETGDEEAIKAALNLVRWMDQAYRDGLTRMRPDTYTFHTVMKALSELPHQEAKIAVVKLFDRMEELDGVENSAVNLNSTVVRTTLETLSELEDKKRAADKACSIFERVSRLNDAKTAATLLDGVCLLSCLRTVLRAGTVEYALRAQELLKAMMQRYRDGTSTHMPLRSGFMEVMNALARSGEENTVELIQEMLDIIDELPFEGYFHKGPGAPFYSKAIDVFIQNDKLQEAEEVLLSWEDKCRRYEDIERPNVIAWNKLIRAWSRRPSHCQEKVPRARDLLNKMKDCGNEGNGGAVPDLTSYNTVLNAASFPGSNYQVRQDALSIAKSVFAEIKSQPLYIQADEVTYGTMLKAVGRLMSRGSEKTDLASNIFEECCMNGKDGPMVMKEVQRLLPQERILEIRNKTRTHQEKAPPPASGRLSS